MHISTNFTYIILTLTLLHKTAIDLYNTFFLKLKCRCPSPSHGNTFPGQLSERGGIIGGECTRIVRGRRRVAGRGGGEAADDLFSCVCMLYMGILLCSWIWKLRQIDYSSFLLKWHYIVRNVSNKIIIKVDTVKITCRNLHNIITKKWS